LAVALPEVLVALLERSAKRAAFLENCRALMRLSNVRVLTADLADAEGSYAVVTFRAVASLARMLDRLRRSRVAWRWLAAFKGRRDRVQGELAALGDAGFGELAHSAEITPLEVPFLSEERHLVVLANPALRLPST
jgi:16S rRNA (guanine527-N7)-methyltransferase